MKIFTQGLYILCRNRQDLSAASEYIFCFLRNVWLLLETFQCFLKNVRLLLKDINERLLLKGKYAADIFVCVAGSGNISMFFNERAAASEKIFNDCFLKKKKVFLEIMYKSVYIA